MSMTVQTPAPGLRDVWRALHAPLLVLAGGLVVLVCVLMVYPLLFLMVQ